MNIKQLIIAFVIALVSIGGSYGISMMPKWVGIVYIIILMTAFIYRINSRK